MINMRVVKGIEWVGSSKKDLKAMPEAIQDEIWLCAAFGAGR